MNFPNNLRERLEADFADTSGIIVPKGQDEEAYSEMLRESVRASLVPPEWITATVIEPGFKHRAIGDEVNGILIAQSDGYWLVYEPNENQYYCFWGDTRNNLGAYGVCGNALYCWWD